MIPLSKIHLLLHMPFHAFEGFRPGLKVSRFRFPLQYLCFKILAHKESGSRIILQPNLTVEAPLMGLIPKAPSNVGLVTVAHATRCGLCSVFEPTYKM